MLRGQIRLRAGSSENSVPFRRSPSRRCSPVAASCTCPVILASLSGLRGLSSVFSAASMAGKRRERSSPGNIFFMNYVFRLYMVSVVRSAWGHAERRILMRKGSEVRPIPEGLGAIPPEYAGPWCRREGGGVAACPFPERRPPLRPAWRRVP